MKRNKINIEIDKNWLYQKYIVEHLSTNFIGKMLNVSHKTIKKRLLEFSIPIRKLENARFRKNGEALKYKNKEWLEQQYIKKNKTCTQISKEIKVHRTTIIKWLDMFNISSRKTAGENHPHWQGGISSLKDIIRNCEKSRKWKYQILVRDGFKCTLCDSTKKLQIDHIKPFSIILKENAISSLEEANSCKELWDVNDGRILCKKCHKNTDTWGYGTFKLLKDK